MFQLHVKSVLINQMDVYEKNLTERFIFYLSTVLPEISRLNVAETISMLLYECTVFARMKLQSILVGDVHQLHRVHC